MWTTPGPVTHSNTGFAAATAADSGRVVPRLARALAVTAALLVLTLCVSAADPAVGELASGVTERRATWLYDALFVTSAVLNLVSIIVWIRMGLFRNASPDPKTPYMTKAECDGAHDAICVRVSNVETDLEGLREAWQQQQQQASRDAEARIVRVYDRLDRLEETLSTLPDRVMALLVNTRRIHVRED